MYLSYDEFLDMGGDISVEQQFPRYELKARRLIDQVTHNRVVSETPVRESVKFCMYELISAIAADEQISGMSGRDIVSMTNDGVSTTYATGSGTIGGGSAGVRYARIIRQWLTGEHTAGGINLLYAGVDA